MSEQVSANHILLMYAGSQQSSATRTKEEAKQQIDDLKSQIDDGGDFGALARDHSDCPSGREGGSLGTFGRKQMVQPFEDVTFGLDVGAVSDVVETVFGFHIIQRTG